MFSLILSCWFLILLKLLSASSHILLILLSLEALMLSYVFGACLAFFSLSSSATMMMTFFTLAVCEASLGLGLLVKLARNKGSDLARAL